MSKFHAALGLSGIRGGFRPPALLPRWGQSRGGLALVQCLQTERGQLRIATAKGNREEFSMILPEEMESVVFLRNLGKAHLIRVASLARLRECAEGTVLFHEGSDSAYLYFVLSGKVGLEVEEPGRGPVRVFTAHPGDLVGWSPVLGRRSMTATARAAADCRLAALDAREVAELCERDQRFAAAFLRQAACVLSDRLWGTRRLLARALGHRPLDVVAEGSD
jgi:CRP-like cAMP-binding protein